MSSFFLEVQTDSSWENHHVHVLKFHMLWTESDKLEDAGAAAAVWTWPTDRLTPEEPNQNKDMRTDSSFSTKYSTGASLHRESRMQLSIKGHVAPPHSLRRQTRSEEGGLGVGNGWGWRNQTPEPQNQLTLSSTHHPLQHRVCVKAIT